MDRRSLLLGLFAAPLVPRREEPAASLIERIDIDAKPVVLAQRYTQTQTWRISIQEAKDGTYVLSWSEETPNFSDEVRLAS